MAFYYNSDTGAINSFPAALDWLSPLHLGAGWHGPFNTKEDAIKYYTDNKDKNPGWKAPAGLGANITNALKGATGDIASGITDPLGKFNLGGWFIRVAEILLGLVLVAVGTAKLTGTTNVVAKAVKARI